MRKVRKNCSPLVLALLLCLGMVLGVGRTGGTPRPGSFVPAQGTPDNHAWESIGPDGGMSYAQLAVDPDQREVLYAGGLGKIYRTRDGCRSWHAIGDGFFPADTRVTAIVVDPHAPSTVYAAAYNYMLRSSDGGTSWIAIDRGLPPDSFIRQLIVDPTRPGVLYALNYGFDDFHVLKTVDGGATWNRASSGLPTDEAPEGFASSPANPSTLFLAMADERLFKSSDGARSWKRLRGGLPSYTYWATVAVDSTAPERVYVGGSDGVFRSTDGGERWRSASEGLPAGIGVSSLVADPLTSATVYAGLVDGSVYRSIDGGTTWRSTGSRVPATATGGIGVWSMAVDPVAPDTFYVSTDVAFFASRDGGRTWERAEGGVRALHVEQVVLDPDRPDRVYVGTSEGLFESSDGGHRWVRPSPQLGVTHRIEALAIHPLFPQTQFAAALGGAIIDPLFYRSEDGGRSWEKMFTAEGPTFGLPFIAVDPHDRNILYTSDPLYARPPALPGDPTGRPQQLLKSTDRGRTWEELREDSVHSFAVDPVVTDVLYAGIVSVLLPRGIDKSTDGGRTWKIVGLARYNVWSIVIHPNDRNVIWAATSGGIFRSTDGGASWNAASNGIRDALYAHVVAVSASRPNVLYAGVLDTVYKTVDGGSSWKAVFTMHSEEATVKSLAIDPRAPSVVYVGTSWRGLYKTTTGGE